jgi:hypothetical protein
MKNTSAPLLTSEQTSTSTPLLTTIQRLPRRSPSIKNRMSRSVTTESRSAALHNGPRPLPANTSTGTNACSAEVRLPPGPAPAHAMQVALDRRWLIRIEAMAMRWWPWINEGSPTACCCARGKYPRTSSPSAALGAASRSN